MLTDDLRPVATGDLGELCIEGVGLSPGYWEDDEKTRVAFVIDPATGRRVYAGDLGYRDQEGFLHFVGRRDSQTKSRGYRIELGEIESAVTAVDGIAECAVVAVASNGFEGSKICCAWSQTSDANLDPVVLRAALADTLPAYMLPSRWLALRELPKGPSGKIDRRGLERRFEDPSRDG